MWNICSMRSKKKSEAVFTRLIQWLEICIRDESAIMHANTWGASPTEAGLTARTGHGGRACGRGSRCSSAAVQAMKRQRPTVLVGASGMNSCTRRVLTWPPARMSSVCCVLTQFGLFRNGLYPLLFASTECQMTYKLAPGQLCYLRELAAELLFRETFWHSAMADRSSFLIFL